MKYEISLYCNSGFGVDRYTTNKRIAMKEARDLQGSANAGDSSAKIVVYALGNGPEPKPIARWGQTTGGRWYRAAL
jgi:hypothetical protein